MVTHTKLMDIDGYKNNSMGFCEKFIYLMSVKAGKTTITQGAHIKFAKNLSFVIILSWGRVLKRRSNCLTTFWILLEARFLNKFKYSFYEHCKYD